DGQSRAEVRHACGREAIAAEGWGGRRPGRERLLLAWAPPHPCRPRLLTGASIAVQSSPLDGLVDRLHESLVFVVCGGVIPSLDRPLEPAEVGLDPRRVAPVFEPLALGSQDALLLGMDIGHELRQSKAAAE